MSLQYGGNSIVGAPYWLRTTGRDLTEGIQGDDVMKLSTYANPELTIDSTYFSTLDKVMRCVERNVHVRDAQEQERVCAKEFKAMRLASFN